MEPVTEAKREFSASQRDTAASRGQAMEDGSFPIANEEDLKNAIKAYGRAKNKEAAKRHIIKRARALGKTSLLPDDWKAEEKASDKPRSFERMPPKKSSSGTGKRKGKFDESKHKRAADGKFSTTAGDGMGKRKGEASRVKKLQSALIKGGFLSTKGGGADGKAGPLTVAAIKKWQKKSGYKATGKMGPGQMKELLNGKKGYAREFYKAGKKKRSERWQAAQKKRKANLTAKKKRSTSKRSFERVTPAPKKRKKNQTNAYSPNKAEMQRMEQQARRNEQISRLIDILFREQTKETKSSPADVETKIRRVRTPAGVRHFDQPIGSIIVADAPLNFLRVVDSDFEGWDKVAGDNGRGYYVGQFDGEKGYVATDLNDNIVLEADSLDDLYKSLDRKVGESMDPKASGGLTRIESDYPGWSKQRGSSGREYYVGKFDGEDVYVVTDEDDNVLIEKEKFRDLYEALKKYDAKQPKVTNTKPEPTKKPTSTSGVPHHLGKKYVDDYNSGWADSKRVARGGTARKYEDGTGSDAYEDGYLDHAAGRDKWETPNSKGEAEGAEVAGDSDLDALFRKPGFEMMQAIDKMSDDERLALLHDSRANKAGDKKFIFIAEGLRRNGDGHRMTGKEMLAAWKAGRGSDWSDADLKRLSDHVNTRTYEEWHEDNSAKIAVNNEVARRKAKEQEELANATDERVITNIIGNGPAKMSEEDQAKIKEWAETASKTDLRAATSAAVSKSRGDRRKASTARADVAADILRAQQKANERQDWDEKRKTDHYKRSRAFFERGGPVAEFAKKMLDNPEYADPNILNWGEILTLATGMSGAIDSYRGIGENDKADKLRDMARAAQEHRDQLQADVDEYLDANAADRKRLAMKFAAVDPNEQEQYLGLLNVTFGTGSRFDQRKGELEAIIRNKKENAVSLAPIRSALSKYVIQRAGRGKTVDADAERSKFLKGLEDLVESGDIYSLYKLLDMLNTTKGNKKATPEHIERMDEMIPLVENGIKRAEDAKDKQRKDHPMSTNEFRKPLSDSALTFDQVRMYSQFDKAVESKDMQTAHVVGRRIINDAKANGSRPGVIESVEVALGSDA